MFGPRRRTAWPAWIVLCAILCSALLPSLAGAVQASGPMTEVCTASGMVRLPVDAGSQTPSESGIRGGVHCPWCVVQAQAPAWPAIEWTWPQHQASPWPVPSATPATPHRLFAWTGQLSRAPPQA